MYAVSGMYVQKNFQKLRVGKLLKSMFLGAACLALTW